jgi:hypothetical protein
MKERGMRTRIACAVLLLATPALAQKAQPLGDSAQAMLGTWELSNAARDRACTAVFKDTRTQVGLRVEFDRNCAAAFPITTEVAGWTFPDGDLLRLVDSAGRTLTEFSEVEDGIYEAPTPGIGVLFLQNPAAAAQKPDDNLPPEQINEPPARVEEPPAR